LGSLFPILHNKDSLDFNVLLSQNSFTWSNYNCGISIIVGRALIPPVDRRPCLTLSGTVLHCFHLATIFKSVGAMILLKRWKEMIITPRRILLAQKYDQSNFFSYEIIPHAKLILLTDFHR